MRFRRLLSVTTFFRFGQKFFDFVPIVGENEVKNFEKSGSFHLLSVHLVRKSGLLVSFETKSGHEKTLYFQRFEGIILRAYKQLTTISLCLVKRNEAFW